MVALIGNSLEIAPFTPEEVETIRIAREHFWYFLENVYIRSFDGETYIDDDGIARSYSFGQLHREWAIMAQYNPRICVMAPRNHLKTTVLSQGFAFWQMFRAKPGEMVEILYISYKGDLASEKIESLARMIRQNPFCRYWHNLKSQAITQINYVIDFGEGESGEVLMHGTGVLGATRGRHPKVTICDDILSDFANLLSLQELDKITRIFRQAIMSLPPNPTDPLLVVGTPQSYDDVLHLLAGLEDWVWLSYPAIVDEKQGVVQWPEKYSFERLKRVQRSIGYTAFEVEYQLTPVRVSDQFFTREDILSVIDETMLSWPLGKLFTKWELGTYGGFDVGRHVHPSHISVFVELPTGTLVQVFSKYLDRMRYPAQVKMLNEVADTFKLSKGYFDSTFNALEDRGLNPAWTGRIFNRKLKADMAVLLEKRVLANVDEPGIILLNDLRQLRQMTIVDKLLQAAVTVDGHGDAFWSNGLAVKAAEDGPSVIDINQSMPLRSSLQRMNQTWIHQLGG